LLHEPRRGKSAQPLSSRSRQPRVFSPPTRSVTRPIMLLENGAATETAVHLNTVDKQSGHLW
jgi:hypothetical protein